MSRDLRRSNPTLGSKLIQVGDQRFYSAVLRYSGSEVNGAMSAPKNPPVQTPAHVHHVHEPILKARHGQNATSALCGSTAPEAKCGVADESLFGRPGHGCGRWASLGRRHQHPVRCYLLRRDRIRMASPMICVRSSSTWVNSSSVRSETSTSFVLSINVAAAFKLRSRSWLSTPSTLATTKAAG